MTSEGQLGEALVEVGRFQLHLLQLHLLQLHLLQRSDHCQHLIHLVAQRRSVQFGY